MANETHYHEFLKLINIDPNDVTSHILERYQDFVNFYSQQTNLTVEQAFKKWCNIKILEPPSPFKELISPIKSSNLVWGADFGFTEIIETLQTSNEVKSPRLRLPALPPPPVEEARAAKCGHPPSPDNPAAAKAVRNDYGVSSPLRVTGEPLTPPPPPPAQSPPHAKRIGYKTMENLNKLKQTSRMETL